MFYISLNHRCAYRTKIDFRAELRHKACSDYKKNIHLNKQGWNDPDFNPNKNLYDLKIAVHRYFPSNLG